MARKKRKTEPDALPNPHAGYPPQKNSYVVKEKLSRLSISIVPIRGRETMMKSFPTRKVKTEMMGKYGPWAKCWLVEFL